MALQNFAKIIGGEEGRVSETAVAGAFVDELVRIVAKDAFQIETAAAGLRAGDGSETG
jgi:hypothetical protein